MGLALGNGRRRDPLDAHDVDAELQRIMANIHAQCREAAADYGWGASLRAGANIAGFKRVADALWEQGAI